MSSLAVATGVDLWAAAPDAECADTMLQRLLSLQTVSNDALPTVQIDGIVWSPGGNRQHRVCRR
ncbi:MAG: hypothetical protein V9E85_05555 [Candidatus Nanopelagicales bacterium]